MAPQKIDLVVTVNSRPGGVWIVAKAGGWWYRCQAQGAVNRWMRPGQARKLVFSNPERFVGDEAGQPPLASILSCFRQAA